MHAGLQVALLAEGVDRNNQNNNSGKQTAVALLAEGVDRNLYTNDCHSLSSIVALLAEGVDRNDSGRFPVMGLNSRPPRGGRG